MARRSNTAPPTDELLSATLARAGIGAWEILICGDGSGSGWAGPCGWGAVLVDRMYRGRQIFYGGANVGSVNLAEAMPYLFAMNWYDCNVGKALLKTQGLLRVHILTDSQVTAQWGTLACQGDAVPLPRKHLTTWATLREYTRLGYTITFHWAPRMDSGFNWAADLAAGLARGEMLAPQPSDTYVQRALAALHQTQFTLGARMPNLYEIHPEE